MTSHQAPSVVGPGGRMTNLGRKAVSSIFVGFCAASVLLALVPLAFVLFYATSPYEDWHRQAWAGALVLVGLVFTCSLLARVATRRLEGMV